LVTTPILEDPAQLTADTPQPSLPPQTRRAENRSKIVDYYIKRGEWDFHEFAPSASS